jgi:ataxin-3
MNMSSEVEYWIYHERQQALLCGQHALNNLVQGCVFSADSLANLALQLDQMELNFMAQNNEGGRNSKDYLERVAEGSANVDPSGNFSIEVLRAALQRQYGLELPNIRQEGVAEAIGDITNVEGFICNKESHWFAIRKINDRYWNLNSMEELPELISHFRLAAEMQGLQDSGYSVFVIMNGLPLPCSSKEQQTRGLPEYWWKEEDLVKGKGSDAITGASFPGSGMRLDGQRGNSNDIGDLSEEEMLQMALAASMERPVAKKNVELTAEPAPDAEGVGRIQFRLPNGRRCVRRFLQSDPVEMIPAFVEDVSKDGQGRQVELRFGFPPRDLQTVFDKTIGEASLNGENIQCRYV